MEGRLRRGLARRRMIAVLARVPLFGLAIFILALDAFFHAKAIAQWFLARIEAQGRRFSVLRALHHRVMVPMPLNRVGGRPGDAPSA